jgi:hypothetical protein
MRRTIRIPNFQIISDYQCRVRPRSLQSLRQKRAVKPSFSRSHSSEQFAMFHLGMSWYVIFASPYLAGGSPGPRQWRFATASIPWPCATHSPTMSHRLRHRTLPADHNFGRLGSVGIELAGSDGFQCAIPDGRRVALAHACHADDGRSDDFGYRVISIREAEIDQCSLVGRGHCFDFVRFKGAVGDQPINGQSASPRMDKPSAAPVAATLELNNWSNEKATKKLSVQNGRGPPCVRAGQTGPPIN